MPSIDCLKSNTLAAAGNEPRRESHESRNSEETPMNRSTNVVEPSSHQEKAASQPLKSEMGLAAKLRSGTEAAHRDAERAPFVLALLRGQVDVRGYAHFLHQLAVVYAALEDGMRTHARHPVVATLYFPELERRAAIERDLRHLDTASSSGVVTDASRRYVARLDEISKGRPELLIAHAYTRYLGDLSGGKVIARRLAASFALNDGRGLEFFEFPLIPDTASFKHQYRSRLDGLPINEMQGVDMVAEANRSFAFNRAIADELWAALSS